MVKKFRVWQKTSNLMIYVDSLNFTLSGKNHFWGFGNGRLNVFDEKDSTLMQFTGATHKGKDIYEDDILENDTDYFIVRYDSEMCRYVCDGVGEFSDDLELCELIGSKDTFIIGNIHQNKNLLDMCRTCKGTGEVPSMEAVYPNEPHTADIGSAPCPSCRSSNKDEDDYNIDN